MSEVLLGDTHYARWVQQYGTLTPADRSAIRSHIAELAYRPAFQLVPLIRADDSPELWKPAVQAVDAQLYPLWNLRLPEAWIADLGSSIRPDGFTPADLPAAEPEGERSAFLAGAIACEAAASWDFVVTLPPGTLLDETSLYRFAIAIGEARDCELVYGDDDRLDATGMRASPRFKTGYDPELMLGRDALGLPVAYRTGLLRRLGGLRPGVRPLAVALHDLNLRASELILPTCFIHVPAVLCHREQRAAAPAWDGAAARAIVRRHLDETGRGAATVRAPALAPDWCQVTFPLPNKPPLVSVIVPTRDRADLMAQCADAVLKRTDYPSIELLIVDNGSEEVQTHVLFERLRKDPRVRILHRPGAFNYAALNNEAAAEATGDVLLLLNNDVDVIDSGWMREMVSQALRTDVGAVGAKLLYADYRVQHAGVVLAPGPLLSHQLRLSDGDGIGPQGELALTRTVLAVTGACLATRRSVFEEVGGLDAVKLQIAFSDIDLCLRLGDHGYRIVWTPFAELLHLESASRGRESATPERAAQYSAELATIQARWPRELADDPFHNCNLLFGWDATRLACPPRQPFPWAEDRLGRPIDPSRRRP
jgi:O-antigen biosynthesis protein